MEIRWLCFVVLLGACCRGGYAQLTMSRTCDCQYMVDGKCAYTLMLPTCNDCSNKQDKMCSGDAQLEDFAQVVESLNKNISSLTTWVAMNARMLNTVQDSLIKQQQSMSYLKDKMMDDKDIKTTGTPLDKESDNPDNPTDYGSSESGDLLSRISDLESSVESQVLAVGGLQVKVFQMQAEVEKFNLVQGQVKDIVTSYTSVLAILQAIKPAVCLSRGLLVNSGEVTISASSVYDGDLHPASKAKLSSNGAWCPSEPNQPEEWIQLDLGSVKVIYSVATKGRSDYAQFVTTFKVQYSVDSTVDAETRWTTFTDVLDNEQIFEGNFDQDTLKVNDFWKPIQARIVRILPLQASGNRCMRVDFIGCLDDPITTN